MVAEDTLFVSPLNLQLVDNITNKVFFFFLSNTSGHQRYTQLYIWRGADFSHGGGGARGTAEVVMLIPAHGWGSWGCSPRAPGSPTGGGARNPGLLDAAAPAAPGNQASVGGPHARSPCMWQEHLPLYDPSPAKMPATSGTLTTPGHQWCWRHKHWWQGQWHCVWKRPWNAKNVVAQI